MTMYNDPVDCPGDKAVFQRRPACCPFAKWRFATNNYFHVGVGLVRETKNVDGIVVKAHANVI
jgi:hypothetical protein